MGRIAMTNKNNCRRIDGEPTEDPYGLLAATIVIQAVDDWRQLCKKRAWETDYTIPHCSFDELRAFFRSDWCAFLTMKFDIDPEKILSVLEAELAEAKLQPPKPQRRRKNNGQL